MEQFRRKISQSARASSKVTAIVYRSSDDKLTTSDGSYRGSSQTARNKYRDSESVSRSCYCDMITDKHWEHWNTTESWQRTSKQPAGIPMKSLLADEISKETVYVNRAPGVVAKLMGLDGMPFHQSSYKQLKRSSDDFHQKTVSTGSLQHQKACKSCKKTAREEYKDVYEVRESSRNRTSSCKSQMPTTMVDAEDEMDIIRKKFMDAKRLSTAEKLHNSKEFHGETEVSDPNNYLFWKFLQDPDSLLEKHLQNLHASQESHCGLVRNLKELNTMSSNVNDIGCTDLRASNKIDYSLHHHVSRKGRKSSDLDKHMTFRTKTTDIASDARTNIVLLKPKIEGPRRSAKFSTPRSSCELVLDRDTHKNDGNKRLPSLDISFRKSRESKELAKEITRQMRNKLGETSFNVSLSGCKGGYSADESSHDVSGNDSSYESYGTLQHPSFHRKSSVSRCVESSVSIEAKKRLSERWKKSRRSGEFSLGAKGSTLGQMLSFQDTVTDVRLPNLNGKRTQDRTSSCLSRNSKLLGAVKPLGISNKDGWSGTSSRPEYIWTAYDHSGDYENCIRDCTVERFLIPTEGYLNGSRKKGVRREFSWNDDFRTGTVSLRDKKVTSAHGSQERRKEMNSSLHESRVLESPTCRLDSMLTLDSEIASEHVMISGRKVSCDDVMPASEFISLQVMDDSSSSRLQGSTQEPSKTGHFGSLQYRGTQAEPRVSSGKVVDHPSPDSVLDTPFVEDLSSSSECFERVSAELHGLRMQLRLLKMETGASSTLISSDEDEGTPSSFSQEPTLFAGSNKWETSFMADMLADIKFDEDNFDSFVAKWHSTDCPVGPHVFESLEKSYSYPTTGSSRSDRRLLFDYINSSMLDMTRSITDSLVKPDKAWFEIELCKVLESAMKVEKEDMPENQMAVLAGKSEWMNLGESIDEIRCEIGNMLLDELVFEAMAIVAVD